MTSLLADLRAQPDFRTELWSQPEAEPKSEVTHCVLCKLVAYCHTLLDL